MAAPSARHGKVYSCTHCAYTTSELRLFTDHMITHSKVYPHGCDICTRRFSKIHELRQHRKLCLSQASANSSAFFRCPHCDFQTNKKDAFEVHATEHIHQCRYKCHACSLGFHHRNKLSVHLEEDHKCPSDAQAIEKCVNREWISAVGELYRDVPQYKCHPSPGNQARMSRSSHGNCQQCGIGFQSTLDYDRHMLEFHRDSVTDEQSDQNLKKDGTNAVNSLQNGTQRSVGDKSISCSVCGRVFSHTGRLSQHMQVYHQELSSGKPAIKRRKRRNSNPYEGNECDICGRVLSNHQNTVRHMLTVHKNVKPKKTRNRSNDISHCSLCDKSFRIKGFYIRHMKRFHGANAQRRAKEGSEGELNGAVAEVSSDNDQTTDTNQQLDESHEVKIEQVFSAYSEEFRRADVEGVARYEFDVSSPGDAELQGSSCEGAWG